jgi:hypothetical protein
MYRRWTRDEIEILTVPFGEKTIEVIARQLVRTPSSVAAKAREIGLGASSINLRSIREVAAEIGYAHATVARAIQRLGIVMQKWPALDPGQIVPRVRARFTGGRVRLGIGPADHERLVRYFKEQHTDHAILYREGMQRAPQALWGVKGRPPCCRRCHDPAKPHYLGGWCRQCHNIERGIARRENRPMVYAK